MAAPRTHTFDVFVSNIPLSARNVKVFLNDAFSKYGHVDHISVREKEHCLTAFVKFTEESAAKNAIVELNKTFFQGSRLSVSKGGKWRDKSSEHNINESPNAKKSYGYHVAEKSATHYRAKKCSGENNQCIKPSGTLEVVVTHIESCWMFWAQPTDDKNIQMMYNIASDLKSYCSEHSVSVSSPNSTEVYAAVFESDNCWYRCKVLDSSDNQCLIRYIDYGNSTIVDASDLRKLPESLQWQVISHPFCLAGLSKPTDENKEARALDVMKATLTDKVVTVDVLRENDAGCFEVCVKLNGDGENVDVGEQFVEEGLTSRIDVSVPKTPLTSEGSGDEAGTYEETVSPLPPSHDELHAYIKGSSGALQPQSPTPSAQIPQLFPSQLPSGAPRLSSPMFPAQRLNGSTHKEEYVSEPGFTPKSKPLIAANFSIGSSKDECENLKAELAQKNTEIQHLKMRATALDSDKRQLTKECSSLQLQVDSLHKELISVHSIQYKLQKGISLLAELHEVRSKALNEPVWYQELVHVVQTLRVQESRVCIDDLSTIDELKDSLHTVEQLQNQIRSCSFRSEVEDLVVRRDDARKHLLLCIDNFLLQAKEKLGDRARAQRLKQFLDVFQGVLENCKVLETDAAREVDFTDLLQKLNSWQDDKRRELLLLKSSTSDNVTAFVSALENLQKEFLSPKCTLAGKDLPDFEHLVNFVIDSSSKEIHTLQEAIQTPLPEGIFGSLVSLMGIVKSELQQTHMLQELLDQYMSLRTVTEDCISVHMSTDDLQVAKRNVRDLRRQYGHKLVDKKEFSMDPLNESAEELELVDAEIMDVRLALHKAFAEEQRQSAFLSKYLEEFPELVLLHPEFNLKLVKDFSGLLSPGRSMEHFEMIDEIKDYEIPVYRSQFLDTACILKEYPLTSRDALDTIVSNAKRWNSVPTDDIVKVVCLSPDLNKQKILVQLTDYYDESLVSFLSAPRSPMVLKDVFKKILKILECFHHHSLVYGGLQAKSVRVSIPENQDINGIQVHIIDFNLTDWEDMPLLLSTTQDYATSVPSAADDMYHFGLLLLLAFVGQKEVIHDKSGRPILPVSSADPILCSVLNGLLHKEPKLRLSAGTTFRHDFFST